MAKLKIRGGNLLSGNIEISGAKNAAVAIIPAAILSDDAVSITNVPGISDINALITILKHLNVEVKKDNDKLEIDCKNMVNKKIGESISKKLRASYYFMGALLGKYKKVEMYFPGGCNIGKRPINLHLMGFEKLGATIKEENNKFTITAENLIGDKIYLDVPSVGATINIMLAAVKANGISTIENAAMEPEIVNVASFLNSMGAKIRGAGTSVITIKGVKHLSNGFAEVIPDRIEAGTYAIIGSLLGKDLTINNVIPSHFESLTEKLEDVGINFKIQNDSLYFIEPCEKLKATNIKTQGYPGFATDLQQPFSVLLTQCNGKSKIEETIYENRFMQMKYLARMGANVNIKNKVAIIKGKTLLSAKKVVATDLRAGASLIIAALIAKGTTTIEDVEHILRGYDKIVEKLTNVGAKIEII